MQAVPLLTKVSSQPERCLCVSILRAEWASGGASHTQACQLLMHLMLLYIMGINLALLEFSLK